MALGGGREGSSKCGQMHTSWPVAATINEREKDVPHLNSYCRLRHFGHPVWKEIQENVDLIWSIYNTMIYNRKVRQLPENQTQVRPFCIISCSRMNTE